MEDVLKQALPEVTKTIEPELPLPPVEPLDIVFLITTPLDAEVAPVTVSPTLIAALPSV